MASPKGILKVAVPTLLVGGLFVGSGIWLGIRNERRTMEEARAAAESRLATIPALQARIALLTSAAPEPGGELPPAFSVPPTRANAIAIHEEDLADLTAPGPVKFRWCSDSATTAACLARKEAWAPGRPMAWQEKPEAARVMHKFANVRYVFVVRTLEFEAPCAEDSFQFTGGRLAAEVFLFELTPNLPLLGQLTITASLGSTASGPYLFQALRRQCRDALWKALGEQAPGADCDAGAE